MAKPQTIRFIIVDDHDIVREGLALLLTAFPDLELVGQASSGVQALDLFAKVHPDVVLIDMVMPEMDGVSAIKRIRHLQADSKIIALSTFGDKKLVNSALEAGATSYLLKNVSAFELAQAIRMTKAGLSAFAPEVTQILRASNQTNDDLDLTARELDVLGLLVQGLTNQEIAIKLGISKFTIKNHVSNILPKLGVNSRTEAVSVALKMGLVEKE